MRLFVPIFSAVNNFPWREIETQGGNCSRIDIFLIDRVSKCHLADLVVQLDKWEWVLASWLRRIEVNDKSSVRGLINVWERDNHRDVEDDYTSKRFEIYAVSSSRQSNFIARFDKDLDFIFYTVNSLQCDIVFESNFND